MNATEFPDPLDFYKTWLAAGLAANGYPHAAVEAGAFNATRGEQVWLQRDGGPRLDAKRELARVRVNCLSDQRIGPFTQRVRALMHASVGEGPVRKVRELSGPTDIQSPKPRRYMLFEVTVVGSSLTLA